MDTLTQGRNKLDMLLRSAFEKPAQHFFSLAGDDHCIETRELPLSPVEVPSSNIQDPGNSRDSMPISAERTCSARNSMETAVITCRDQHRPATVMPGLPDNSAQKLT